MSTFDAFKYLWCMLMLAGAAILCGIAGVTFVKEGQLAYACLSIAAKLFFLYKLSKE